MTQLITRQEIQHRLDGGAEITFVEALPYRFYAQEHLPGAIQINHDEIDTKAPELLTNKDAHIVVYCSNLSCANSGKAAQRLQQLGYKNVYKYAEGKQDWIEAGLPVEST